MMGGATAGMSQVKRASFRSAQHAHEPLLAAASSATRERILLNEVRTRVETNARMACKIGWVVSF
jgi:hypothetical protein